MQAETVSGERRWKSGLCSRKIGWHTRSVISLFWLEFLIALPIYWPVFRSWLCHSCRNYRTVAKKNGIEESKQKSRLSLFTTKYLPRTMIWNSKSERFIFKLRKGRRYCALQRSSLSLRIRFIGLTLIKSQLTITLILTKEKNLKDRATLNITSVSTRLHSESVKSKFIKKIAT